MLTDKSIILKFKMIKDVLIQPKAPYKVTKEITEQIPKGTTDSEGFREYDTKTEVKSVDSDWSTGVVLNIPANSTKEPYPFKVGDEVLYNKKFAMSFDLVDNAVLVKPYDIVAVVINDELPF